MRIDKNNHPENLFLDFSERQLDLSALTFDVDIVS